MQILLASAKTMRERSPEYAGPESHPACSGLLVPSVPAFQKQAEAFASELARMSAAELSELFGCSPAIAELNRGRFRVFATDEAELMPAVMAYHGQAYRHLRADRMTLEDLEWADSHLFISSCMYGLLRPLDGINPYRMEGSFPLRACSDASPCGTDICGREKAVKVNEFWRPLLTDMLIDAVKSDDGVLLYLDTEEFRTLFDWKRVASQILELRPSFHIRKGSRLTTPSVWAKTCRGAMARYVITGRISDPRCLEDFSYEGFHYDPGLSTPEHPVFVREA